MNNNLNSYFKMLIESFDLSKEKRNLINRLYDIMHEYNLNMGIDSLNEFINSVIVRIKNDYINEILKYKEDIDKIISSKPVNGSLLMSAIDNVPKINFEITIMGAFEDGLYRKLRQLESQSRQFEYLPNEVKKQFLKFTDAVNENIRITTNNMKKYLEDVGLDIVREKNIDIDFKKSKEQFPGELLGVNFDDEKGCFWIDYNGEKRLLNIQGPCEINLDENHFIKFSSGDNKGDTKISIFENKNEIKSIYMNKDRFIYTTDNFILINNNEDNTVSISNGFSEEKYDLDNMSIEDIEKLKVELRRVDDNVFNYYAKNLTHKKLESLFL